jgi:hypothetical protein
VRVRVSGGGGQRGMHARERQEEPATRKQLVAMVAGVREACEVSAHWPSEPRTSSISELMRSRRCFSTVLWLTDIRGPEAASAAAAEYFESMSGHLSKHTFSVTARQQ